MKFSSCLKPFLLGSLFALSAQSAHAVGKEEASCSDKLDIACATNDPEILEFRKSQLKELYLGLVYPGPIEVMKNNTAVNHLFQEGNVAGRVTPLGQFTDFNGVVEYFYALAANPETHVYEVKIVSLIAGGEDASVNIELSFCKNSETDCSKIGEVEKKKETLTEAGVFKFNKQNKIIFFDLIIPNLGASKDVHDAVSKASRIAGICAFLTVGHVDPITQEKVKGGTCTTYFDSKDDFGGAAKLLALPNAPFLNCVAFMGSLPFGSYDRANSNTFTCRQTHALLTPLRPEYHCQHVAYDGGGKCVDFPYGSFYEEIKPVANEHAHP